MILTNKTVQENTDKQTQYKSEKVDNLKYSKTKLPWFSCLLQHSARKRDGLISTTPPSPHGANTAELIYLETGDDGRDGETAGGEATQHQRRHGQVHGAGDVLRLVVGRRPAVEQQDGGRVVAAAVTAAARRPRTTRAGGAVVGDQQESLAEPVHATHVAHHDDAAMTSPLPPATATATSGRPANSFLTAAHYTSLCRSSTPRIAVQDAGRCWSPAPADNVM